MAGRMIARTSGFPVRDGEDRFRCRVARVGSRVVDLVDAARGVHATLVEVARNFWDVIPAGSPHPEPGTAGFLFSDAVDVAYVRYANQPNQPNQPKETAEEAESVPAWEDLDPIKRAMVEATQLAARYRSGAEDLPVFDDSVARVQRAAECTDVRDGGEFQAALIELAANCLFRASAANTARRG